MTSEEYVEFLLDHFLPWYKNKNHTFCNKILFTHDNALSNAASNASVSLAAMGIKLDKLMMWSSSFLDPNPVENFWSIGKYYL